MSNLPPAPGVVFDEPQPINGGWQVGTFGEDNNVYVLKMMFNYRVVQGDGTGYSRFWCFYGTGPITFVLAVSAAQEWLTTGADEPRFWNKNGQSQTYRTDLSWEKDHG